METFTVGNAKYADAFRSLWVDFPQLVPQSFFFPYKFVISACVFPPQGFGRISLRLKRESRFPIKSEPVNALNDWNAFQYQP